jgi:hypothetical protein
MAKRFNPDKLVKCMARSYSKKYAKAKRFSIKKRKV